MTNASSLVSDDGAIFIALYQNTILDHFWKIEKRFYSRSNKVIKSFITKLWIAKTKISFKIKGLSFEEMISYYQKNRGMNYFINLHDLLGGYPYEAIYPDKYINLFEKLGFNESYSYLPGKYWALSSCCNEYILKKKEKKGLI